jgi:predicted Zn-dependent protease
LEIFTAGNSKVWNKRRVNDKPADELIEFPDEVRTLLKRADGFLDLAMPKRARAELDQIPEKFGDTSLLKIIRLRLAFTEHDWPQAAQLARLLCERFPDEPAFWIEQAYAVRRAESIGAAKEILLVALERFPKVATVHYNLACYDCQLGSMESALIRLERAVKLDSKYQEAALEDDDLKPLWDRIA